MSSLWKVVCGFNGVVYSEHDALDEADQEADRLREFFRDPTRFGSLASHVSVVPIDARFTSIIRADNQWGCLDTCVKRWVSEAIIV